MGTVNCPPKRVNSTQTVIVGSLLHSCTTKSYNRVWKW